MSIAVSNLVTFKYLLPTLWLFISLVGTYFAINLLTAAAHDRGIIQALELPASYDRTANRMVRVAWHRLAVAALGLVSAVVILVQPAQGQNTGAGRPTLGGFILLIALIGTLLSNTVVSYLDIRDREFVIRTKEPEEGQRDRVDYQDRRADILNATGNPVDQGDDGVSH